mgnify:CR=1 FL=1
MQSVTLNNGVEMPLLGFGVFQVNDPDECVASVAAALQVGYRLLDTAAAYGNEAAVGRAIAASGIPRAEIFVTTKLSTADQGFRAAQDACRASLDRLATDYVDAYLILTDNAVVSAAESVIQVAEDKGTPVFASDESTMERGAAAGLSVNYTQQGRDAAKILVKMLGGTKASEIPVETQKEFDLFVNEAGATAQGFTLPESIVSRATKKF